MNSLDRMFVADFYLKRESKLYEPTKPELPEHILALYKQGDYEAYGAAVKAFRSKQ